MQVVVDLQSIVLLLILMVRLQDLIRLEKETSIIKLLSLLMSFQLVMVQLVFLFLKNGTLIDLKN